MSGRPDHASAHWREDGVEEAEAAAAPGNGVGSPEVDDMTQGGPHQVADDDAVTAAEGAEPEPILTDVAALAAQRDEYLESLQRLKADFDNYRKRVARLQEEQAARAEANLVAKLLPVLDNLDLAWAHLGPSGGTEDAVTEEARAIAQARGQLLDVLGKEGLERVDQVRIPFDPTVHDAVAHAEAATDDQGAGDDVAGTGEDAGDGGANGSAHVVSVDEVFRAGYRWRGQVLRPAMVRVRG